MNSKLFTALGITSALTINLGAATSLLNQSESKTRESKPNILLTIPELFKNQGYETISLGKVFHNPNDHADAAWSQPPQGYFISHATMLNPDSENWIGGTRNRGPFFEMADVSDWEYLDGQVTLKAMEELDKLKESDNPFFLAVGFMRPHLPFYAPKKYWDMYNRDEIPLATFREKPESPIATFS